jgi:hypothetical protein
MKLARYVRNCIATLAALALLSAPAQARQASEQELAACRALTDHIADLVRAGETTAVGRSKLQLQRCIRMQRAEARRAARETVDRGPPKAVDVMPAR